MFARLLLVLFATVTLRAEATPEFSDFPVQPISEHPNHAVANGLAVAVDAIREKKVLKDYFDKDMVTEGYLPVHVVIQNVSTDTNFLFLTDNLAYVVGVADLDTLEGRDPSLGQVSRGTKIFINPAAVLITPGVFLFTGMKINKAAAFRHNILTKELTSQTIAPGETIRGFILFPIEEEDREEEVAVRIRLSPVGSQSVQDYEFVL